MIKKLFVVLTFIFSFSFVWANVKETLDSLTENKDTLIDSLNEKKDNLLDQKQDLKARLEKSDNYKILLQLDKLDEDKLNDVTDGYDEIENSIYDKFISIESNINTLNRRKELDRLTGDVFDQTLSGYNKDIQNYLDTHDSKLESFVKDGEEILSEYESNYQYYLDALSGDLENIDNNIETLNEVFDNYDSLSEKINDVDKYYLGRSGDIQEFINEVKEITKNDLKEDLNEKYKNISNNIDYIDYYDTKIQDEKDSIIAVYVRDIENEFEAILDDFYDSQEWDAVKNTIDSFENTYLIGSTYKYAPLSGNSIRGADDVMNSMSGMITQIENKFEQFDNAKDEQEIKGVLQKEVMDFYRQQRKEHISKFDEYLEEREYLLKDKLQKELKRYNTLIGQYGRLENTRNSIINFQNKIQNFKKDVIADHRAKNLTKRYWELETKLIDMRINDEYKRYAGMYSNLSDQLDSIIGGIKESYIQKNQPEKFEKSANRALGNIEDALEDNKVSDMHKYLFLEIKKHFLIHLYIQ